VISIRSGWAAAWSAGLPFHCEIPLRMKRLRLAYLHDALPGARLIGELRGGIAPGGLSLIERLASEHAVRGSVEVILMVTMGVVS
jgi:hypothetical protein